MRNSAFFAFYQAIICRLFIFQGITLWHFLFVTFQKITSEIHYHSSYIEGWKQRFRFQKKKISYSRHTEVWLQRTDNMWEILFFSEKKVVLLMLKQNEYGLTNQICGITVQNSCYIVTFFTWMMICERWCCSQLFKSLWAVWGFFFCLRC